MNLIFGCKNESLGNLFGPDDIVLFYSFSKKWKFIFGGLSLKDLSFSLLLDLLLFSW